jgi:hypothetical protein
MSNALTGSERADLLVELGIPEDVATTTTTIAPPVIVEQVDNSESVNPVNPKVIVAPTLGYSVTPVSELPISAETFAGVPMRTPEEHDAAYRKVFDAYKQPRKLFPGYNKELTKFIRAAIKQAQPDREPSNYVKSQAVKSIQKGGEGFDDLVAAVAQAVIASMKGDDE